MAKGEGRGARFGSGVVSVVNAELHWYEAHGIGRKEFKVKRLMD